MDLVDVCTFFSAVFYIIALVSMVQSFHEKACQASMRSAWKKMTERMREAKTHEDRMEVIQSWNMFFTSRPDAFRELHGGDYAGFYG